MTGIHLGVTELEGLTAPSVGAFQQLDAEDTAGVTEEPNNVGVTRWVVSDKYFKRSVRGSGVGDAGLANVTAGEFAKGTVKLIFAEQDETQKGLPKFSVEGVGFFDLEEEEEP